MNLVFFCVISIITNLRVPTLAASLFLRHRGPQRQAFVFGVALVVPQLQQKYIGL
jgi:hypothetical protein